MATLNEREAARFLDVSAVTLARWRKRGRAPRHTRMGRDVKYDEADLLAFKAAHTHGPETEPTGAA